MAILSSHYSQSHYGRRIIGRQKPTNVPFFEEEKNYGTYRATTVLISLPHALSYFSSYHVISIASCTRFAKFTKFIYLSLTIEITRDAGLFCHPGTFSPSLSLQSSPLSSSPAAGFAHQRILLKVIFLQTLKSSLFIWIVWLSRHPANMITIMMMSSL